MVGNGEPLGPECEIDEGFAGIAAAEIKGINYIYDAMRLYSRIRHHFHLSSSASHKVSRIRQCHHRIGYNFGVGIMRTMRYQLENRRIRSQRF